MGKVNEGWTFAKRLLQYERTMIGGGDGGSGGRPHVASIAQNYIGNVNGRIGDAVLRDEIDSRDDRAFGLTVEDLENHQQAPSFVSSMFKLYGTGKTKRDELLMKSMGSQMLGWEGDAFSAEELDTTGVASNKGELD